MGYSSLTGVRTGTCAGTAGPRGPPACGASPGETQRGAPCVSCGFAPHRAFEADACGGVCWWVVPFSRRGGDTPASLSLPYSRTQKWSPVLGGFECSCLKDRAVCVRVGISALCPERWLERKGWVSRRVCLILEEASQLLLEVAVALGVATGSVWASVVLRTVLGCWDPQGPREIPAWPSQPRGNPLVL